MATNPNYSFHIHQGAMLAADQITYEAGSIVFEEQIGALSVVITKGSSLLRIADGIKGLTINKSGDVPTSVVFTLLGGTTQTLDLTQFQTADQVSSAISTALEDYVNTENIISNLGDMSSTATNKVLSGAAGYALRQLANQKVSGITGNIIQQGSSATTFTADLSGELTTDAANKLVIRIYTKSNTGTLVNAFDIDASNIATKTELSAIPKFQILVVGADANGQPNIALTEANIAAVYLVPKGEDGENNTLYEEFIAVDTDNDGKGDQWESLGTAAVDLQNYYTKTEANDTFAAKSGTATPGNIVTWNEEGKVVDSGIGVADTVGEDDDKIPTSRAVFEAVEAKIPLVADAQEDEIPLFYTAGDLKASGKKITTTLGEDDTTVPTSKAVSDKLTWSTWPTN